MISSSAPPDVNVYPTLLFSWWCTGFAAVVILLRLAGRKVRTGVLFREDLVMALALIPLFVRMGLVHVVLIYGTNNVELTHTLTPEDIHRRAIGSRLVLASRIFYAMFIWISKFTVSEFLKRLTSNIWRSSYETVLHCIRVFLVVTFIAVVIATLAECQPFDHYWQVMPDPGPQCRQGFAQLITMGAADIITDILLIAFPIPIIMASHFATGRKITLILLFSFSLALIAITATRVPEVISHHGRQQYRTVWASCEILASAFVSNAVIVGSFIRDKGVKRTKYRRDVGNDSLERTPTRRPTMARPDSDEDLFATIGCRLPRELYAEDNPPLDQPEVAYLRPSVSRQTEDRPPLASLKEGDDAPGERPSTSAEARSQTPQSSIEPLVRTQSRKSAHPDEDVELGDAGGLLGGDSPTVAASSQFSNQASSDTATSTADFASSAPSRRAARPSVMGLLSGRSAARRQSGPPPPVTPAPASAPLSQIRSGSTGGAAGPSPRAPPYRAGSHNTHLPMELKDVGGLIF